MEKVVNNIRLFRNKKKLTQKELATRASLAEPTIRNVEQNIYTGRLSTLQKVANALEVNIKDLFKENDELNEIDCETYETLGMINRIKK